MCTYILLKVFLMYMEMVVTLLIYYKIIEIFNSYFEVVYSKIWPFECTDV